MQVKEQTIRDIRHSMIDMFKAGFAEAVRLYEPSLDQVRRTELKPWLKLQNIDPRDFKRMEATGMIRPRKMGDSINSPMVYSKAEISKAVATLQAEWYAILK